MLTRRAPTNILVCTIALWVIAGFLPSGPAYAAATGPAYHQEDVQGGGTTVDRRDPTLNVSGDPDEYAQADDGNPISSDGSRKTFIGTVLQILAVWWTLVWGIEPQ